MAKEKRIKLFGRQLETILKELEQRDLKEVPTDKLFDLLLKYARKLREEETAIQFRGEINYKEMLDLNKGVNIWEG